MAYLVRVYRIINILSLDVAAGAILSALLFSRILDVDIRPYGLAALALTVWIIYTADHLSDAKKISGKASSERHRFHQRHFKMMILVLVIAVLADAIMLAFIKKPVFISGLYLSTIVGLYLLVHRRLYFLKEILVSILYTAGILLPSLTVTHVQVELYHAGFFLQFFLIVLSNLLIFSWFDADHDRTDKLSSFVTHFGKGFTGKLIFVLLAIFFLVSIFQFVMNGLDTAVLVLFGMGGILAVIFAFPSYFSKSEYYRILGDAVFILPAILLL